MLTDSFFCAAIRNSGWSPYQVEEDATVGFDVGSDTFLFTQGNDAGGDAQDVVVRLVDVQIDSLINTNGKGELDLYIV